MARLLLILLVLALTALSMPTGWSEAEAKFYSGVSKEIQKLQGSDRIEQRMSCDLSKAKLPQTSEPLPDIPQGQKLLAVAVGRGTQNYTCDSDSGKPSAKGALATLFDATCMAANYPHLLSALAGAALHLDQPEPFSKDTGISRMPVMGHHFFSNGTTAVFDLVKLGPSSVMKKGAVNAPKNEMREIFGQKSGSVPWLFLESIPSSTGNAKTVYRVDTAGGMPPADCAGQPKDITVQYSSEYWFYG
ncbi:hypothetical protein PRK78_000151 [Emydomyces testavorans]|uniref:Malate dehydrogenase n=1 Tax=Emydomyces testavorans TaxID=2070801 RepID=A0AAF0DB63_9EURO|nr:hypothetical protein PRK78_000151 [Emydomyces testavorans]